MQLHKKHATRTFDGFTPAKIGIPTRLYSSNKLSKLYTKTNYVNLKLKPKIVMNYNSEHNNLKWAHVPQRMYTNA